MNIEECKNHYLGLKNIKNSIEKIEPEFFFEFAETVITAYEKEKEKNNELLSDNIESFQKYFSEEFHKKFIDREKLRKIIYPSPENPIPIEVQQSEMYKRLLKEVEETNNE